METEKVSHYWIYVHDENGDFVDDRYRETLEDAIQTASSLILEWLCDFPNYAIHIVDQIDRDSETVWVAGSCTLEGKN